MLDRFIPAARASVRRAHEAGDVELGPRLCAAGDQIRVVGGGQKAFVVGAVADARGDDPLAERDGVESGHQPCGAAFVALHAGDRPKASAMPADQPLDGERGLQRGPLRGRPLVDEGLAKVALPGTSGGGLVEAGQIGDLANREIGVAGDSLAGPRGGARQPGAHAVGGLTEHAHKLVGVARDARPVGDGEAGGIRDEDGRAVFHDVGGMFEAEVTAERPLFGGGF